MDEAAFNLIAAAAADDDQQLGGGGGGAWKLADYSWDQKVSSSFLCCSFTTRQQVFSSGGKGRLAVLPTATRDWS